MRRILNTIFGRTLLLVSALAVVACSEGNEPDGGKEPDGDGTEVPKDPEKPEGPEAPEIIENNGVGEDGKIALNSMLCAYYLGDVWDTGVADYYVMLSNDTIGLGANGFEVPMHQGGWILYLDLWSEMSTDTANAVLPEGTYTFGGGRDMGCFYSEFSLATNNKEQVLVDEEWLYDIRDVFFKSGTVVVEHTENGYHITTDVVTTNNETLSFVYDGPITFEDQSDDEEWRPVLDMDIEFEVEKATMYKYGSYEEDNCDNYVIMLFNTTELSYDGAHPNIIGGMRLLLDIYPELGMGIEGSYTVGTLTDDKYLLEKEPWVYYPGCYWGSLALGTFVEYVDEDGTILYSVIKSGDITITANDDGTHTIVIDTTNEKGNSVTCNWTGVIENHTAE